ncbi:MAG TPA: hypothetical protein VFW13_10895, partial [Phenylobacterium sp.]|nr:hypothetical protein [Phenylobacterium sp.]
DLPPLRGGRERRLDDAVGDFVHVPHDIARWNAQHPIPALFKVDRPSLIPDDLHVVAVVRPIDLDH